MVRNPGSHFSLLWYISCYELKEVDNHLSRLPAIICRKRVAGIRDMDNTKQSRLLEMFFRGLRGEDLSVQSLASEYGVSKKSISRDLNDLKAFFAEHRDLVGNSELEYSYQDRVYRLRLEEFLSSKELFSLVEVFIGARAYSKIELLGLVEKLKRLTTPSDRKRLDNLIKKEIFHYHEVHHDCESVQDTLWQLVNCISTHKEITVYYHKATREYVERRLRPLSILFSEYYFYLIAFRADKDDSVPIYYRVDRISKIVEHRVRFELPDDMEFDEGLFRSQNQFMFPGKKQVIKFEYSGPSVQAILDRLPTAHIIEKRGTVYILEAVVLGEGIKMYLLSQGAKIKVLEPEEFVNSMRNEVRELCTYYGIEPGVVK